MNLVRANCVAFISDMADAYGWADLIVCRAGAATMGELCMLGRPALLVPSPFVAENHHEKNARALEQAGGALAAQGGNAAPGPRWWLAAGAMAGDAVAGEQGRVLWARGGLRRAECWQQQTGGQKCNVFDSCMRLLDKRLSHILFEIWRIQARAHGCGSLRWMMGMLCLRSGARRTNSTIFSCCGDLLHTGSVAAASPVTMKAWQRQPPKSL